MTLQKLVRIEKYDERISLLKTITEWVKEEGGVMEEEHHFDGFSARFTPDHMQVIAAKQSPYTYMITIHSDRMIESFWNIAKKLACLGDEQKQNKIMNKNIKSKNPADAAAATYAKASKAAHKAAKAADAANAAADAAYAAYVNLLSA